MFARTSSLVIPAATLLLTACAHHTVPPSPGQNGQVANRVHVRKIVQSSDIAIIAERHELVVGQAAVEVSAPRDVAWQTDKPGWTIKTKPMPDKGRATNTPAIQTTRETIAGPVRNMAMTQRTKQPISLVKETSGRTVREVVKEQVLFVGDVLFEKGSSTPKDGNITEMVATIRQHGTPLRITVIGHADRNEDEKNTQVLSERRAEAVASKLSTTAMHGVPMETVGKGDQFIIGDTGGEEGRARNRRAEVLLTLPKQNKNGR